MIIKKFNLKQELRKRAFYESVRGYWTKQLRSWANCYKAKSDSKQGPQEAWTNCLKEYQDCTSNSDWALKYTGQDDEAAKPYFDAKTPFAQKLASLDHQKYDDKIIAALENGNTFKKAIKGAVDSMQDIKVEKK